MIHSCDRTSSDCSPGHPTRTSRRNTRSASLRLLAALACVGAASLTACYTFKQQANTSETLRQVGEKSAPLRIITTAGRRIQIYAPALRNDSLFDVQRPLIGYPIADIAGVETRKLAVGRTVIASLAGAAVIALIVAIALEEDPPPQPQPTSCPHVYSWDGQQWHLDSGTFGGAIAEALARTDVDNLEHVAQIGTSVRLLVKSEQPETDHIDEIALWYVDHLPHHSIAPGIDGKPYVIEQPVALQSAFDGNKRNVTGMLRESDGAYWESRLDQRDVNDELAAFEPVELVFPKPVGARQAKLIIRGRNSSWSSHMLSQFLAAHGRELSAWYHRINTEPAFVQEFHRLSAETGLLNVAVQTEAGWERQGIVPQTPPDLDKTQLVVLDLGNVRGDELRVRLQAPPSYWLLDYVAVDYSTQKTPIVHQAKLVSATIASGESVLPVLESVDGKRQTLETGEEIDIKFEVPPRVPEQTRSFLLRSSGWYQIHIKSDAAPDPALKNIMGDPAALRRIALMLRNNAITRLEANGRAR